MTSFITYANTVKWGKAASIMQKNSYSCNLHINIREKLRKIFPEEIISLIFTFVYQYMKKFHIFEIEKRFWKKSIWWEPSIRLKRLCGGRGAIQHYHFDIWSLFGSFIPFKEHNLMFYNPYYLPFTDENEEEYMESDFYRDRNEELCTNCLRNGFPCINFLLYEETDCLERNWDIRDEPSQRYTKQYLDLTHPNWEIDEFGVDRYWGDIDPTEFPLVEIRV